jgi:putative sterol carrier protein
MSEQSPIMTPEEFAKLIEGRSDVELNEAIKGMGIDSVFDQVFTGMAAAFLPEKAGQDSAVVQWDIATPEGARSYHIVVAGGKCEWKRGAAPSPRVTLSAEAPIFMRMITGKMVGIQAFFSGQLKVSGDMMFAQVQESWFKKPG